MSCLRHTLVNHLFQINGERVYSNKINSWPQFKFRFHISVHIYKPRLLQLDYREIILKYVTDFQTCQLVQKSHCVRTGRAMEGTGHHAEKYLRGTFASKPSAPKKQKRLAEAVADVLGCFTPLNGCRQFKAAENELEIHYLQWFPSSFPCHRVILASHRVTV